MTVGDCMYVCIYVCMYVFAGWVQPCLSADVGVCGCNLFFWGEVGITVSVCWCWCEWVHVYIAMYVGTYVSVYMYFCMNLVVYMRMYVYFLVHTYVCLFYNTS